MWETTGDGIIEENILSLLGDSYPESRALSGEKGLTPSVAKGDTCHKLPSSSDAVKCSWYFWLAQRWILGQRLSSPKGNIGHYTQTSESLWEHWAC